MNLDFFDEPIQKSNVIPILKPRLQEFVDWLKQNYSEVLKGWDYSHWSPIDLIPVWSPDFPDDWSWKELNSLFDLDDDTRFTLFCALQNFLACDAKEITLDMWLYWAHWVIQHGTFPEAPK